MTRSRYIEWISPPGETIADLLDERGWSKSEFAERLGCTPKHVSQLLAGHAPIHAEMAASLSRVLGSTPEFWLEREARYRAALDRKNALDDLASEEGWLRELPLSWMVKEGLVERYSHKGEQVDETLRFFGVASVSAWRGVYGSQGAAFRASATFNKDPGAVAAWLRRAEVGAEQLQCGPWSAREFRSLLPTLRELTFEASPEAFMPRLVSECAKHGVAVVLVPTPPGCPASGATRWLTPTKAMLVLSLRHRTNDHFWFTFFHEAGHLVLHSKKVMFVEGMDGLDGAEEAEADTFSRELLIPPRFDAELARLKSISAVRDFALRIGVHPGIVVGRLQKDGRLPWKSMNGLKISFDQ